MQNSTSSLLREILASGACVAVALCAALPAAAHGRSSEARTAAPARVHYAAPARVHYAAPARVHYAAPARVHYAAPAPFVQRVAPERSVRNARATKTVPFEQYVRPAPRVQREAVRRTVVSSPLVRAVYASRTRTIPVVYHPRYLAGRVAAIRRDAIVIDPPAGAPVIVRDVVVGTMAPVIPVGSAVTLPVTYVNGGYTYAAPPQGYAPQYQYAYAPPIYCAGNSSTALYAALLPALVGVLTGNGGSLNSNGLTSLALTAAGGTNICAAYSAPVNYGYAAPVSYAAPVPVTYAIAQAAPAYYGTGAYNMYATPYDNCLSSDEDGDEGCAQTNGYMYDNYSTYGAYTPQQVQGVVVGRSGDMLMVLGSNGTPTFVYAAPALQSGFAANGPISPGQIVDAYGYYSGNTFIATAIV